MLLKLTATIISQGSYKHEKRSFLKHSSAPHCCSGEFGNLFCFHVAHSPLCCWTAAKCLLVFSAECLLFPGGSSPFETCGALRTLSLLRSEDAVTGCVPSCWTEPSVTWSPHSLAAACFGFIKAGRVIYCICLGRDMLSQIYSLWRMFMFLQNKLVWYLCFNTTYDAYKASFN